jgi:acetylornithine deacetylase/succinyl-diaminopimelate desuccinylase-like protein
VPAIDPNALTQLVSDQWDRDIVPQLVDYIRLPCKSPHFDPQWQSNGHIDAAVALAERWCRAQAIPGLRLEVLRLEGRTPLLFFEVPGDASRTVLLYGHLDKQPEMIGWRADTGPWTPLIEEGKLYGRGGADDGYAVFASLSALRGLHEQKIAHARCVGLIECCEESGSYDLPAYLQALAARIG